MFEFTIEVLSYELNFWENRNKFKVAKDHIAELNQVITLLEKADNLTKENIDLKANLEMAKGWHSGEVDLNDKLMKENTNLKKLLKSQAKNNYKNHKEKLRLKKLLDKDRIEDILRGYVISDGSHKPLGFIHIQTKRLENIIKEIRGGNDVYKIELLGNK